MLERDEHGMTAGRFAKRAGVTIRTVRFYDKVGLLPPSRRTDNGYRHYELRDLARLQRILTLKYIGLSIDEIKRVIQGEGQEEDLRESLRVQSAILQRKIDHLRLVQKAVANTLEELDGLDAATAATGATADSAPTAVAVVTADSDPGDEHSWDRFTSIIRMVTQEEKGIEQYRNASHLLTRIRLHDRFSINPYNWHRWVFDQLQLPDSPLHILELGCGDGSLWQRNLDRLPADWRLTLSDYSEGMLQDAQSTLADVERAIPFQYAKVDARAIPYPDASFDAVLANHMLYHVNNRGDALKEIYRVLKPGGRIYASTIGSGHLREMKELLAAFDPSLVLAEKEFDQEFGLDNGAEQLAAAGFQDIDERRYEDGLRVTQSEPLIAYIRSTTGNSSFSLSGARLARFKQRLDNRIRKEGYIGITKETGLFIGCKKMLEEDAK